MAAPSRSAQFTKLHKVLKKHYTPVVSDANRTVLEHLMFAGCLENAHFPAAEEAFAALVNTFFDWNEIRVSTVRELSEVLAGLPDPVAAANRVKRPLQSMFEAAYSFDLEETRKQNIGQAIERLEKIEGTTKFTVAYVVQAALGGHSIPIDSGTLGVLRLLDLASEEDAAKGTVPGLERAIPKQAGVEFGSLLHQLGADFVANPYRTELHHLLVEIEPSAKDRLPSRRAKRAEEQSETAANAATAKGKKLRPSDGKMEAKEPVKEKEAAKKAGKEASKEKEPAKEPPKPAARELPAEGKKKAASKAAEASSPKHAESAEPPKKKEPVAKEASAEEKKSPGTKKKPEPEAEKTPAKKKPEATKAAGAAKPGRQEAHAEGLSKRKPR